MEGAGGSGSPTGRTSPVSSQVSHDTLLRTPHAQWASSLICQEKPICWVTGVNIHSYCRAMHNSFGMGLVPV